MKHELQLTRDQKSDAAVADAAMFDALCAYWLHLQHSLYISESVHAHAQLVLDSGVVCKVKTDLLDGSCSRTHCWCG